MARFFIVYEHRLFAEIMLTILGQSAVKGLKSRQEASASEIVEAINEARPSVVVLEQAANGNSVWQILLSAGRANRVVVLDIERGLLRDYNVKAVEVSSLDDLHSLLG